MILRCVFTLALVGSFPFTAAAQAPQSFTQAMTQTIVLSSAATSGGLAPGADRAAVVGADTSHEKIRPAPRPSNRNPEARPFHIHERAAQSS